jgi:hypothetical protein
VSTTSSSKDRNAANVNRGLQRRAQPTYDDEDSELDDFVAPKPRKNRRMIPVHQSRIADRPIKKGAEDSSLKIKIELDLEVEVSRATPTTLSLLKHRIGRDLRPRKGRYNDWADVIPVGRALRKSEGRHNYRPTGQIFDVQ